MHLAESGEMYLETILTLTQTKGRVRSIDVSEHMGYSKPSVSRAIGLLKSGGYLTVGADGSLELTDVGLEVAERIYERHTVITDFLTFIGVDKETAAEDACKIEHDISNTTLNAIKNHLEKLK